MPLESEILPNRFLGNHR